VSLPSEAKVEVLVLPKGLAVPRRRIPRALDLFCCAGGASMGLARAGFIVTGVDVEEQSEYPLDGFDFIWASPPCQAFTAYKCRPDHVREREREHDPRGA
jgi:site-specific DNA-cytosine methylase